MANASGFVTLDAGMLDAVKAQLLCEISKGSGGSGLSVTLPTDVDAANFVCGWLNICSLNTGACTSTNNCPPGTSIPIGATCASFCGINQKLVNAISDLTTSLKSAGLWDLMDVIYPFVGGNAGACSLNMKDTTKFAITWHGGVTFSAAGATGDGATGYGDTGYNPSVSGVNFVLNSGSLGFNSLANNQTPLGGASDVGGSGVIVRNGITGWVGEVNCLDAPFTPVINTGLDGNYIISRTAANATTLYTPSGNSSSAAAASGITAFSIYILSQNVNLTPTGFSPTTIKFAFAGSGLSAVQIATLSGIINTFVAAK